MYTGTPMVHIYTKEHTHITHTHTHIYIHIYIYTHTQKNTHTHIYTKEHTHTHTCITGTRTWLAYNTHIQAYMLNTCVHVQKNQSVTGARILHECMYVCMHIYSYNNHTYTMRHAHPLTSVSDESGAIWSRIWAHSSCMCSFCLVTRNAHITRRSRPVRSSTCLLGELEATQEPIFPFTKSIQLRTLLRGVSRRDDPSRSSISSSTICNACIHM